MAVQKAYEVGLKDGKIADGACEKMNPGLAETAKKAEGLDAVLLVGESRGR